jgi:hypothetical protein
VLEMEREKMGREWGGVGKEGGECLRWRWREWGGVGKEGGECLRWRGREWGGVGKEGGGGVVSGVQWNVGGGYCGIGVS